MTPEQYLEQKLKHALSQNELSAGRLPILLEILGPKLVAESKVLPEGVSARYEIFDRATLELKGVIEFQGAQLAEFLSSESRARQMFRQALGLRGISQTKEAALASD